MQILSARSYFCAIYEASRDNKILNRAVANMHLRSSRLENQRIKYCMHLASILEWRCNTNTSTFE